MKRVVLMLVLALLAVGSLGESMYLIGNASGGGAGGCFLCLSNDVVYGAGLGVIGFLLAMAGGIVAEGDSRLSGRRGWRWGLLIGLVLAGLGPGAGISYFSGPITPDERLISLVPTCGLPFVLAAATLVYGLLALARRSTVEMR